MIVDSTEHFFERTHYKVPSWGILLVIVSLIEIKIVGKGGGKQL